MHRGAVVECTTGAPSREGVGVPMRQGLGNRTFHVKHPAAGARVYDQVTSMKQGYLRVHRTRGRRDVL